MKKLVVAVVIILVCFSKLQAATPQVFFMEPEKTQEKETIPVYRLVTDETRLSTFRKWIDNDAARWAFDLYSRALKIKHKDNAGYYIALVEGGNHAEVGFRLLSSSGEQTFPDSSYIKLDPDGKDFKATLLHETGHMILAILNGGKKIPQPGIASIPHTTAALTDRGTAFDEGFAIHLETLAAHYLNDPEIRSRYDHQSFQAGVPSMLGEYHRVAGDLLSYSQTSTRYVEVRENNFAFAPAFKGPDYFRVQLEKSRDFTTLRDANQLLQSEGFHASFFFTHLVRGIHPTYDDVISNRQTKMLDVLAAVLSEQTDGDTPFLLRFVENYLTKYSDEGKEVLDVFLDLSHGVFIDKNAAKLWRDHYLGALHLDIAEKENKAVETARNQWRTQVTADPKILYSLLGPQIPVELPEQSILLVAFEESAPLAFDVNTVEEGIIQMVPGITAEQKQSWINQRTIKPFSDFEDFKKRSGLDENVLQHFKIPQVKN
jgi:hypothetical protein